LGVRLNSALAELPEILRAVVVLHDIEGLHYDEIAQIIGRPLGTVKSRLFNARAALRKKLAPYVDGSLSAPGEG
jgi:RNA polymerase sigma-70 factor (ECF subfamily)